MREATEAADPALEPAWSKTHRGLPQTHVSVEMLHCIGWYKALHCLVLDTLRSRLPVQGWHQALMRQAAVDPPPGILSLQADSQRHISHSCSETPAASTTR